MLLGTLGASLWGGMLVVKCLKALRQGQRVINDFGIQILVITGFKKEHGDSLRDIEYYWKKKSNKTIFFGKLFERRSK